MTTKQRKAIEILHENPRKSVSGAMREAGYSEQTASKPSELTNSRAYKSMYAEQMEKANITTDQYFSNIGEGMRAVTTIYDKQGNIVAIESNLPLRLQANKQAEPHLFGKDKQPDTPDTPQLNTEDMIQAIKDGNIEELQRIVFRKDS